MEFQWYSHILATIEIKAGIERLLKEKKSEISHKYPSLLKIFEKYVNLFIILSLKQF
jgi:hypothetical protein